MNPWAVDNLKEFLYYCCPECEGKVKSLEDFLQHALNQHDLAKEILPKIIVKEEFDDYETVSQNLQKELIFRKVFSTYYQFNFFCENRILMKTPFIKI